MKIKGTCRRDGREFLVEQVVRGGGSCPWDGEPFNADYASLLVAALSEAEEAGSRLEQALQKVADLTPAFTLDPGSIVAPLRAHLERLERPLVRQG